ncbi:hypothetical protein FA15DRAFT_669810 [Coprinopsis marcescibilis]|uniref:Ricin B lectin domain-containing protein n=1 Tax=Coprinopsis marcescibilis TaxID=230819 RepID=A0A5C3KVB9_COPMA|nr:hypothetical protein FA15DRAFT_669810 [Coprinopsis marcescibilis]
MPFHLEDGRVYRFISQYNKGVIELLEPTKVAVIKEPTGSKWQQWKAIKVDCFWKFESVAATGYYLGFDRSTRAKNGLKIIGTSNKDAIWYVTIGKNIKYPNTLQLCIPYTKYVLDTDAHNKNLESVDLQLWEDSQTWKEWNRSNQVWILDQDIEPAVPCVNGGVYHIQNVQTGTVIHFESHTGNVRSHHYNEGRNQLWEATRAGSDESLWSFKNILNGRYLSIGGDIAELDQPIIGSNGPFRWRLVPSALNSSHFELYVPHVDLSMDVKDLSSASGAKIKLSSPSRDRLWRFEKVAIPNQNMPLWAQEYPGAG